MFETPNPKLEEHNSPFYVNDMLADWDAGEHGRYAGVSSFGLGGINAHLVMTEAPLQAEGEEEENRCELLVLSAKSASALERMCANMAAHIEIHPQLNLSDVAYTLKTGRAVFAASKSDCLSRTHRSSGAAKGCVCNGYYTSGSCTGGQAGRLRKLLPKLCARCRRGPRFIRIESVIPPVDQ
ncbi:ketoacyl-synthetase C-terminal extension domain-containing protein [Paenibacillus rhizoplanae]